MAQLLRYSPPEEPALSYTFVAAHPQVTGGESDIFIQIQGPSSMSWVALGQGASMKGSQMFIIYANALGTNVTLSPRLSSGYNQPSTETQYNISLLAGSGIANGNITANILCQKCNTWNGGSMDLSGPNQPWIWAYKNGNPIKSNSTSVHIQQHDDGAYANFALNMNTLSLSNSSNPFLDPINIQTTDTGDSSAGYNGIAIPIHGVILCLAFTIGFPFGAFLIRLASFRGLVWIHAIVQMLSYLAAVIGLGLGVYIANQGAADVSIRLKKQGFRISRRKEIPSDSLL